MNDCDEYVIKMLHYLDSDPKGRDLEDFWEQAECCASCRLQGTRSMQYLGNNLFRIYSVPSALRGQVSAIIRRANRQARDVEQWH